MPEETARAARCGNCPSCGHHNGEWETRCEKCGRRLSSIRAGARPAAVSANGPASTQPLERAAHSSKIAPRPPAFPEHLRQQLQERVHRFRTRQENPSLHLPFEEPEPPSKVISFLSPISFVEEEPRALRAR